MSTYYYDESVSRLHVCNSEESSSCKDQIWNSTNVEKTAFSLFENKLTIHNESQCINWNQYFTSCQDVGKNLYNGVMNFDNFLNSVLTIFVAISTQGWTRIMYFTMEATSYWSCIYFISLIIIGSIFAVNLFLVVLTTNFTAGKSKEHAEALERGKNENGVLQEEQGLYGDIIDYIAGFFEKLYQKMPFYRKKDDQAETNNNAAVKRNVCSRFQSVIAQLVKNPKFAKVILIGISINTVFMALESHNQPPWLSVTMEYSNLFFTFLYASEMVLKLIGLGLYGYIKDPLNAFDGTIVIISIIELSQEGSGSLAVLRTFRLLRLVKLLRFMPGLLQLFKILAKAMSDVGVFLSLLALLIFIFSLTGTILFGEQLCLKDDGVTPCACTDLLYSNCHCQRSNFDTFFNASLAVFQVLTRDDWTSLLFSASTLVDPTTSAAYFVTLFFIGNYIMMNLVVAILVQGCMECSSDERRDYL